MNSPVRPFQASSSIVRPIKVADLSDAQLLDSCRGGDHRGWAELVGRHQRFVYSVARSNGLDEQDAGDVLQITFSELLAHLDDIKDPDRLRGWLGTIARRQSWRMREARRASVDLDAVVDLGELDADIERVAVLDSLMSSLDQLDEPCRSLLERLFLAGGDEAYKSVANDLEMAIGSIGPTRQRCLDRLRELLEQANPATD